MSKWIGSVTPTCINLTRGGGGGILAPLVFLAAIAAVVAVVAKFLLIRDPDLNTLLDIVVGSLMAIPTIGAGVYFAADQIRSIPAKQLRRKWELQDANRTAQPAVEARPEPVAVACERVDELPAPAPIVEPKPVNLDAIWQETA